jgi:O-antigen/teichoic acid export membrane protein
MLDRIKKITRLSSIYTAGNLGIKIVGFLLYPVYAAVLTPAEFGIVGLALLVSSGSKRLFTLGTDAAAFNFYHRYDDEDRAEFYGTLFFFIVAVTLGFVFIFERIGPELSVLLFGRDLYDPYLRVAVAATALSAIFQTIPLQRFRAMERADLYTVFNAGSNLTSHGASLVGVLILSLGALGYILGNLVASVVVGLIGAWVIFRNVQLSFSTKMLKTGIVYSLPLFPHFYSHFLISMSDRAILSQYSSLDVVGVYTIAYSLAGALQVVVQSGNSAILPEFARDADLKSNESELVQLSTYYLLAAGFATVGFTVITPTFVLLFFSSEYVAALSIIPVLGLAFLFVALYNIPMNMLSQRDRETRFIPIATLTAAGLNLGLNLLFIPTYGIWAAAFSTLSSYALLFVQIFLFAQYETKVDYQYRRVATVLAVTFAFVTLDSMLGYGTGFASVGADILLLAAFAPLLWVVGFWKEREKRAMREFIEKISL